MPYVITTITDAPHCIGPIFQKTRTAVATLDEARVTIGETLHGEGAPKWCGLDVSGGTVGPLPDGTVIEVRRVTYADLIADAPDGQLGKSQPAILAAFNAR